MAKEFNISDLHSKNEKLEAQNKDLVQRLANLEKELLMVKKSVKPATDIDSKSSDKDSSSNTKGSSTGILLKSEVPKSDNSESMTGGLMNMIFGNNAKNFRFKSAKSLKALKVNLRKLKFNSMLAAKIFYKNHPTYVRDSADVNNMINFTDEELKQLRNIQRRRKEAQSEVSSELLDMANMRFKSLSGDRDSQKNEKKHKLKKSRNQISKKDVENTQTIPIE